MILSLIILTLLIFHTDSTAQEFKSGNIITSDINHFWTAYDQIKSTEDSILQYKLLDSLYLQNGTLGLKAMIQVKNYTSKDYIEAINLHPKFWESIRDNTLKVEQYQTELEVGIEQLKAIYPDLKPAKIYFTIGALRSNGTTLDSLVLIGSELAMSDNNTPTSEFPKAIQANRRKFFDSQPIENLVLLNVHEYVHTQQKPALDNLLSYVIREGVAEFISCKAMNIPSSVPAIEFGKQNDDVRKAFEKEMFYGHNLYQWLWGDASNEFGVRDLGYYIGYQLSELFYNEAKDKSSAIKQLIELDYSSEKEIEDFVNGTEFFSASLEDLYQNHEQRRPTVIGIHPFENNSTSVNPNTQQITIKFSEPIHPDHRNFDYGPLGESTALSINDIICYSEDGKALTIKIADLKPNQQYQLTIGWGFRNLENVPLKEYLIDFKTSK